MRATSECAAVREWFLPGTEPRAADTWIRAGRTTLPEEYTEWAAQTGGDFAATDLAVDADDADAGATDGATERDSSHATVEFRLVSPLDGDVYRIPPGVPPDFASIPLRATGLAGGAGDVRWFVDGKPFDGARWRLARGTHVVRAVTRAGEAAEARISVH
jgi:hypothetical protein